MNKMHDRLTTVKSMIEKFNMFLFFLCIIQCINILYTQFCYSTIPINPLYKEVFITTVGKDVVENNNHFVIIVCGNVIVQTI